MRSTVEGDVTPGVYIPKMIQWYREGKMPVEKIITFYPVSSPLLIGRPGVCANFVTGGGV